MRSFLSVLLILEPSAQPHGEYEKIWTLESWHTAVITNSDNNSKPLPKQYATLVRKTCNR